MLDEPEETPSERIHDPAQSVKDKVEELRMFAELAAVFEGVRKYGSAIVPGLDAELVRDVQMTLGKLEKARIGNELVVPLESLDSSVRLLTLPEMKGLSTGDYHLSRRPGEVKVVRWLAGEEAETFYVRLQAHFEAAFEGHKEDERQAHAWKADARRTAYLKAIDTVTMQMEQWYHRKITREAPFHLLSTQTADEINIVYLTDQIMGIPAEDLVGAASAPPADPTEQELAWFFKLYLLRGVVEGVERFCLFTFLQKTDADY